MRQTTSTLAALLALVVGAGAIGLFAYFGVHKKDERELEKKAVEDSLLAMDGPVEKDGAKPAPLTFTKLTVRAKGETTVLERTEGGDWKLTSPVRAPADKLTVDAMLSQLQTAKLKYVVEEKADEATLRRYGLLEPRFSVTAVTSRTGTQESKEQVLHGGLENAFDGSIYVRRGDEPKVASAEGGVRWALEKSSYELREKQVLAVDEAKVTQIEVKTPARTLVLERTGKKTWRMQKPSPMEADAATVGGMLATLRSERALSFPEDSPANRRSFGFEKPQVEVSLLLEGDRKIRVQLALETTDGPSKAYALLENADGTTLAEITPAVGAALNKDPLELRDRAVLTFDKEQVAQVRFLLGDGQQVLVERGAADAGSTESWQLVSPTPGKARAFKLSSILWALGALKASRFVEENPADWSRYGINPHSRSVALLDGSGKELARLTLGEKTGTGAETLFVRGNRPVALEADGSRLAELPSSVAELLETTAIDGG